MTTGTATVPNRDWAVSNVRRVQLDSQQESEHALVVAGLDNNRLSDRHVFDVLGEMYFRVDEDIAPEFAFDSPGKYVLYGHVNSPDFSDDMPAHNTLEAPSYQAADYDSKIKQVLKTGLHDLRNSIEGVARYSSLNPEVPLLSSRYQGCVILLSGDMAMIQRTEDAWVVNDSALPEESQLPTKTPFYAKGLPTESSRIGVEVLFGGAPLKFADSTWKFGKITHSSQDIAEELSNTTDPLRCRYLANRQGVGKYVAHTYTLPRQDQERQQYKEGPASPHPALQSFSRGFEGVYPSSDTINAARIIVEAAEEKTLQREIEFDDSDGALAFELRLTNGYLVIGELSIEGELHVDVFDDEHPDTNASIKDIWVENLPRTTASELVSLF